MVQITLNDEQARLVAEAASPVPVYDRQGQLVGHCAKLSPSDERDLDSAKQARDHYKQTGEGEFSTTEEVLRRLGSIASE